MFLQLPGLVDPSAKIFAKWTKIQEKSFSENHPSMVGGVGGVQNPPVGKVTRKVPPVGNIPYGTVLANRSILWTGNLFFVFYFAAQYF